MGAYSHISLRLLYDVAHDIPIGPKSLQPVGQEIRPSPYRILRPHRLDVRSRACWPQRE